jgi:hypothetical protein
MIPKNLHADDLLLTVRRLSRLQLPDTTVAQVSYHVGWLAALDAVLDALDVPDPDLVDCCVSETDPARESPRARS